MLKQLVEKHGAKDWSNLAEKLNEVMTEQFEDISSCLRNGKQCRERWLTALDPNINKSQWTAAEDIEFL